MRRASGPVHAIRTFLAAVLLLAFLPCAARAQTAEEIVRKVVANELWESEHDHSCWMYLDSYKSPSKNQVKLVIQTQQGSLSEIIQDSGHIPSSQEHQADIEHINRTVNNPSVRAQQRKSDQHDDQQAANLLKMLPDAFIWHIDSENNGQIQLSYHPNPNFSPPSMASRVMASMSGTMTIDRAQMRIGDLTGKLMQPVEFAWGLLGHLNAGGTFEVLRSQIGPHIWQITQTHVHISGHVLFFKNIGDQEDEVTSDYHRTPDSVDLQKAQEMLLDGEVAKDLGVADPFAH